MEVVSRSMLSSSMPDFVVAMKSPQRLGGVSACRWLCEWIYDVSRVFEGENKD